MYKKTILLYFFSAISTILFAQEKIVPKKNLVDKKFIHDQQYKMLWTMVRDTSKIDIGQVETNVVVTKKLITVITKVQMKGAKSSWIDSTVVHRDDLSPLYHSSRNAQRDMVIRFDDKISGYHLDHQKGKRISINEKGQQQYFDSNFYPILINWLPLDINKKAVLDIYDFNPNGKIGLLKVHILKVSKGAYTTKRLGIRPVWIVEFAD